MRCLMLIPLLLLSVPMPASAQESAPENLPGSGEIDTDGILLGAGVVYLPDYEGSADMDWTAAPGGRAQRKGYSITWRGNRAWADVIPDNKGVKGIDFSLGPLVNINFNRAGKVKDAQVNALGKVPLAIEGGVQGGIGYQGLITSDYDKLAFSVGYVRDLGSVHKSYVLATQLSYSTPLSRKAYVYLGVGADYAGNGYADRYFGVTPGGAAASGLTQYDPEAGWKDWNAGAIFDLALTGDLTGGIQLIGAVAYSRLLGEFAASPLTRSKDQWFGVLGLAYSF